MYKNLVLFTSLCISASAFANEKVSIDNVSILDAYGTPLNVVSAGQEALLKVNASTHDGYQDSYTINQAVIINDEYNRVAGLTTTAPEISYTSKFKVSDAYVEAGEFKYCADIENIGLISKCIVLPFQGK
ncbi:hypothetical protein [uncultured Aliivibrio sp.]|uniref:hypothetical protein n=1 Tax=uncultured Aliivibrio sp. TaxID=873085 RepID=UPI002613F10A|nr:hypothetical protein [uncultured Aliivibrio sp.]